VFRYSGNKTRLLKHLPSPPPGTRTIVEPFAGSLAYAMFYKPVRIVAAEVNPYVRGLWEWLRSSATVEMLSKIEEPGQPSLSATYF
jgi:site-specific DNA-adenine methylase